MKLFKTTRDIFAIKNLRGRIAYTLLLVLIYRLGTYVLLPWIDPEQVKMFWENQKHDNLWDRLIGTSFNSYSIFSLGIQPYISASVMMQLASFAIPYFQRLQQEGTAGRSKLNHFTRQLTIVVAVLQCIPTVLRINSGWILGGSTYFFYISAVILMTSGAMFSVWLADNISERGLGSGASVLIMVGMVTKFPAALKGEVMREGQSALFLMAVFALFLAIVLAIIVFMQGTRKIPLQYARHMMVATRSYRSPRQYLPVKMNATGVMPVIFANITVGIVAQCCTWMKDKSTIANAIAVAFKSTTNWQFNLCQGCLIFIGTFMYVAVFINPTKIANELKQSNGFIPGVKPGRPTAQYIDRVTSRIIFPGAIFLAMIAMIPALVSWEGIGVTEKFSVFCGGTSMLIVVGVMLEMVYHVNGHLHMARYDKMIQDAEKMPDL